MKRAKQEDGRQLKLDLRVSVEPVLAGAITGLTVAEVEQRAREHFRWAKQLYVLIRVMRTDGMERVPPPAARVPPCSCPERN